MLIYLIMIAPFICTCAQPQDELQTSLLEAAGVEDTAMPEPTEVSLEYTIHMHHHYIAT